MRKPLQCVLCALLSCMRCVRAACAGARGWRTLPFPPARMGLTGACADHQVGRHRGGDLVGRRADHGRRRPHRLPGAAAAQEPQLPGSQTERLRLPAWMGAVRPQQLFCLHLCASTA